MTLEDYFCMLQKMAADNPVVPKNLPSSKDKKPKTKLA